MGGSAKVQALPLEKKEFTKMNENQTTAQNSGSSMTLWEILRLLLGKWYALLLTGLGVGIAVFLVLTFLVAPTYKSNVSFYVYNSEDTSSGTINNSDLQAASSLAETYSKILESNSVLDAVLEDLGTTTELSRKDLSEMVDVSVISDTQLLEVVVTSKDAAFACEIATSFAKVAPTEIVRVTKAGGVEVVDQPEVATEKASPRRGFDTVVAAMVGVILMAIVVILRAASNKTIILPEDVENAVGVTVLGQIPEIEVPQGKYTHWTVVSGGGVRYDEEK